MVVGAGFALLYALLAALAVLAGWNLELTAAGAGGGVPLPRSWPAIGTLGLVAIVMLWLGRRWDRPAWAAFRKRRPWLVPVVVAFGVFPALVVLLFLFLQ